MYFADGEQRHDSNPDAWIMPKPQADGAGTCYVQLPCDCILFVLRVGSHAVQSL